MKAHIWLGYDLGMQGDYPGFYAWLDERDAKPCVDGLAYVVFEFNGKLLVALKKSLSKAVRLRPRDQIYLVYRDGTTARGAYVFGKRKKPPWSGWAEDPSGGADVG